MYLTNLVNVHYNQIFQIFLALYGENDMTYMALEKCASRPQGYKTFYMLNSAEHEIYCWHFHIY